MEWEELFDKEEAQIYESYLASSDNLVEVEVQLSADMLDRLSELADEYKVSVNTIANLIVLKRIQQEKDGGSESYLRK